MFPYKNVQAYHAALLSGKVNVASAVEWYLAKIKASIHLNAFLEVFEDAMERAVFLDTQFKSTGKPYGKLHGVIIGIKDVISYKGHNLTAGSKMLEGYIPVYNATVIEKLLAEGAVIIGRQNCDEFAMGSSNENSFYGHVKNAVAENRVPGGSSGGSAVAVQAGLCMVSLGSDTGGSVRQPADFCGCIGFKPAYGRISRHGLIAYASSFDQIGIIANDVDDVALVLETINGQDSFDSTCIQHKLSDIYPVPEKEDQKFRIAYFPETLSHPSLDPFIQKAITKTLEDLQAIGHTIFPVQFPLLDFIVPAYYTLTTAEASSNLSRYDGIRYGFSTNATDTDLASFYINNRTDGFGKEVKRRIMLGTFVLSEGFYDAYFTKAQQVRRLLKQQTGEIFSNFDLIISPVSPGTAFEFGAKSANPVEMYIADIYTVFANLTGIPAISIPLYKHENGMPFGIQAMSNTENELLLLQFAKLIMKQ